MKRPVLHDAHVKDAERFYNEKNAPQHEVEIERQYAEQQDPATRAERAYWWELLTRIDAKKAEIKKWESATAPTPSEMEKQDAKLLALRGELAALEAQYTEPYPAPDQQADETLQVCTLPPEPLPIDEQVALPVAIDVEPKKAKNVKRWTPAKLAELAAYRAAHTMPETAVKFGITEQRIRALLPSDKPKAKPFAGLIHRIM